MKKIVILLLMLGILAPLTVRAELKSALEMADDFISKNNITTQKEIDLVYKAFDNYKNAIPEALKIWDSSWFMVYLGEILKRELGPTWYSQYNYEPWEFQNLQIVKDSVNYAKVLIESAEVVTGGEAGVAFCGRLVDTEDNDNSIELALSCLYSAKKMSFYYYYYNYPVFVLVHESVHAFLFYAGWYDFWIDFTDEYYQPSTGKYIFKDIDHCITWGLMLDSSTGNQATCNIMPYDIEAALMAATDPEQGGWDWPQTMGSAADSDGDCKPVSKDENWDGDGLSNEAENSSDPPTNPWMIDSDMDSENSYHYFDDGAHDKFPTDPYERFDSDNDGMGDMSDPCPKRDNCDDDSAPDLIDGQPLNYYCQVDKDRDGLCGHSVTCPTGVTSPACKVMLDPNDNNLDSDADGAPDFADKDPSDPDIKELTGKISPDDIDGDGLCSWSTEDLYWEIEGKTVRKCRAGPDPCPLKWDCDGDWISDGGVIPVYIQPTILVVPSFDDEDGDGVPNEFDAQMHNPYCAVDEDGDGLCVDVDPNDNDPDTDSDGIPDFADKAPSEFNAYYQGNLKAGFDMDDIDDDGICDSFSSIATADGFKCKGGPDPCPWKWDCNNDGVSDGGVKPFYLLEDFNKDIIKEKTYEAFYCSSLFVNYSWPDPYPTIPNDLMSFENCMDPACTHGKSLELKWGNCDPDVKPKILWDKSEDLIAYLFNINIPENCDISVENALVDTDNDGQLNCVDSDIDGDGLLNTSDPDTYKQDTDCDGFLDGIDCSPAIFDLDLDSDKVPDSCDDSIDVDGDGEGKGLDCDDADPKINHNAQENCDNDEDDNCDGAINEGCKLCYKMYASSWSQECDQYLVQKNSFDPDNWKDLDSLISEHPSCYKGEVTEYLVESDYLGEDGKIHYSYEWTGNPAYTKIIDTRLTCYVVCVPSLDGSENCDFDEDGIPNFKDPNPYNEESFDKDSDGFMDTLDNCPSQWNMDQSDTDVDSYGDACDPFPFEAGVTEPTDGPDSDKDGTPDECDDAPNDPLIQHDIDGDGIDNEGESGDIDGDGYKDWEDGGPTSETCKYDPNDHEDSDGDGLGDNFEQSYMALDAGTPDPKKWDTDGDGLGDGQEILSYYDYSTGKIVTHQLFNPLKMDTDDNGISDLDEAKNGCKAEYFSSASYADADSDGQANCYDSEADGDTLLNDFEAKGKDGFMTQFKYAIKSHPVLIDTDKDGFNDNVDNCPNIANPDQKDTYPFAYYEKYKLGDACDWDDDHDGTIDFSDCEPLDPDVGKTAIEYCVNKKDDDCDGSKDEGCYNDFDGDGLWGGLDNCPYIPNFDQKDSDGNGIGDICEAYQRVVPSKDLNWDTNNDGCLCAYCTSDKSCNPGFKCVDGKCQEAGDIAIYKDLYDICCSTCDTGKVCETTGIVGYNLKVEVWKKINDFDGDNWPNDYDEEPLDPKVWLNPEDPTTPLDWDLDGYLDFCDNHPYIPNINPSDDYKEFADFKPLNPLFIHSTKKDGCFEALCLSDKECNPKFTCQKNTAGVKRCIVTGDLGNFAYLYAPCCLNAGEFCDYGIIWKTQSSPIPVKSSPDLPEICDDKIDNNCDGKIDEGGCLIVEGLDGDEGSSTIIDEEPAGGDDKDMVSARGPLVDPPSARETPPEGTGVRPEQPKALPDVRIPIQEPDPGTGTGETPVVIDDWDADGVFPKDNCPYMPNPEQEDFDGDGIGEACEAKLCPDGMVFIKGGTFKMGSDEYEDEKPVHDVTISDFCMDENEFTNKNKKDLQEKNPTLDAKDDKANSIGWDDLVTTYAPADFYLDDHPLVGVSWYVAKRICDLQGKRLPTEAEWEYAARGGTQAEYGTKDGAAPNEDNACWSCENNSCKKTTTCNVRSYPPPNAFGLYDMSGNAWEWVSDWYALSYDAGAQVNPIGPTTGVVRVLRGGSWYFNYSNSLRVADRGGYAPSGRNQGFGFRCAVAPQDFAE